MRGRRRREQQPTGDVVTLEVSADDPTPGWVLVPLDDEVPAHEWALAVHRFLAEEVELAGGTVDHDAVTRAAQRLADVTVQARDLLRGRGGFAHAWVPDPAEPLPLWLDVVARPEDGFTEWAERLFAEGFAQADPHCEVTDVDLPAGPSVRVRSVVVPDEPGVPATEAVDVLVRPPGVPGRVVLSSRWVDLARGDELAAVVDRYARTVRVRAVRPQDGDAAGSSSAGGPGA
ncbi:hypothetical protein [Kineococcus aurantiacus]|uniref:Uncharacterized protein n=2 Tax=Kineococcus aurantiacus TaxID=37633 RepID=A0A7Y9AUY6_9ACTN|nr:hypothetical protein [Kineococcus aurantiacus]NYD21939.1 hypothetical protein [Kineococcus aurantiacus]